MRTIIVLSAALLMCVAAAKACPPAALFATPHVVAAGLPVGVSPVTFGAPVVGAPLLYGAVGAPLYVGNPLGTALVAQQQQQHLAAVGLGQQYAASAATTITRTRQGSTLGQRLRSAFAPRRGAAVSKTTTTTTVRQRGALSGY